MRYLDRGGGWIAWENVRYNLINRSLLYNFVIYKDIVSSVSAQNLLACFDYTQIDFCHYRQPLNQ